MVDQRDIEAGLRELGLGQESDVVVHGSLRSFGRVDGGARTVVDGLVSGCRTVVMMAGSWNRTGVPAPPGLIRPNNAFYNAEDWAEFDRLIAAATPYTTDLPVDDWLGVLSETLRVTPGSVRGQHPTISFVGVGDRAAELISAESLQRPLGSLELLAETGGGVLLLGVTHTSNTMIHVAEQRFGRGCFYRYARLGNGLWTELPNVSGASHLFDEIEPQLRPYARQTMIGTCRARWFAASDVIEVTTKLITEDPYALLCDEPYCRCSAARQQIRIAQELSR
jgi:aminoglycoside 3-N-acetyltransferase